MEFTPFFIDTNHCVALNSTGVAFYFYKTNRENLLHTQYTKNSNYFLRTKNVTLSVHLAFNYKSFFFFKLLFADFTRVSYLFYLNFTFNLTTVLSPEKLGKLFQNGN